MPDAVPKATTSPGAVTGLPGAPGEEARAAGGTPTAAVARLITLKRRSEFLRVRKGARFSAPAFVLEAKARANVVAAEAPIVTSVAVSQKSVRRRRIEFYGE